MDYFQKSKPKSFLTTTVKSICIFVFLLFQINAHSQSIIYCENPVLKDMVDVISGGLVEVKVLPIPPEEDTSFIKIIFIESANHLPPIPWQLEPLSIQANPVHDLSDFWINPGAGHIYFKNIRIALSNIDRPNADIYSFNEELYSKQLEDLEQKISNLFDVVPLQKRMIISDDPRFLYIANAIQWSSMSINSKAEGDLESVKEIILKQEIPAVFIQYSPINETWKKALKQLDVQIISQLHNTIGEQADIPATYLDLLEYNAMIILEAMQRTSNPKVPSPFPTWLIILIFALPPLAYLIGKLLIRKSLKT